VPFFSTQVLVHPHVQEPLLRVTKRLEDAVAKDGSLRRFLTKIGGTYNDRVIAGTSRKSAHAYGIAIDLSVAESAYWRTSTRFSNRYPSEIVTAFEAEQFIWGGRWRHFDTMHFEFRPEYFDAECKQ
jgi:hypothetical protein